MITNALVVKRFAELESQMNAMRESGHSGPASYETAVWQQWATSAQHIISVAFGESSPHYKNFSAAYGNCSGMKHSVDALKGIFGAAKADYEGGYIFSMQALISGEIYGDFVALAKGALAEGAKDVAAVLACAALEDALKRLALLNNLEVSDKTMQDVVNALKAKGLVGGCESACNNDPPLVVIGIQS